MMSSIGDLRRSIFRFQHYNSKAELGKTAEFASTAPQRRSPSTIDSRCSSAARLHIFTDGKKTPPTFRRRFLRDIKQN